MKKKTILLIALVIMVTGAAVWGVSALAGQKVSLNSADFYADCAKRANEAQRGQLKALENDEEVLYQRSALEIIGQLDKSAPRLSADKASELAGTLSGEKLSQACDKIAGAPDMRRDGSGIDVLIYNFDAAASGWLVIVNGQGFVEHKNAQGEYVTVQPDGTVTAGPTLSAD